MLRASLTVVVLGTAYVLLNLLRPARPEPAVAGPEELERARPIIAGNDQTLANAALTGDNRLLFSDAGDSFLMYQTTRRSWVALGDPVGAVQGAEELVWRLREMSDRHGADTVFYQVCGERLALYVDLGLAALKIGEEARVPLAEFSLEGAARADLRQSHRRAQRDGVSFEVVPAERVAGLLPLLQPISAAWLAAKSTAEKGFSVGAFRRRTCGSFRLQWYGPAVRRSPSPISGPLPPARNSRSISCVSIHAHRAARWITCSSS